MNYDSQEEINNRLLNTVISYRGAPVHVWNSRHRDGRHEIEIIPWPYKAGAGEWVDVTDPGFNRFQTVPLGYANALKQDVQRVFWCHRIPARRMRQGLCEESFGSIGLFGDTLRFADFRKTDGFLEMVLGEYPSLELALDLLTPNGAIAVDRDFMVNANEDGFRVLNYRRMKVGLAFSDRVLLTPNYGYLKEHIIETANLPNRVENLG